MTLIGWINGILCLFLTINRVQSLQMFISIPSALPSSLRLETTLWFWTTFGCTKTQRSQLRCLFWTVSAPFRGRSTLRLPSPEYPPSQVFEDSTARIQNFELLKQLHCQQHITVFVVSKVFREELLIQEKNISNQTNLFNSLEIQEACIRLIFIA